MPIRYFQLNGTPNQIKRAKNKINALNLKVHGSYNEIIDESFVSIDIIVEGDEIDILKLMIHFHKIF